MLSKEDIKKMTREDVIEYSLCSKPIDAMVKNAEQAEEVLPELERLGIVHNDGDSLYFYMDVEFTINRPTVGYVFVTSFTYRKGIVYPLRSYPPTGTTDIQWSGA